jgi:hypothetical protein
MIVVVRNNLSQRIANRIKSFEDIILIGDSNERLRDMILKRRMGDTYHRKSLLKEFGETCHLQLRLLHDFNLLGDAVITQLLKL